MSEKKTHNKSNNPTPHGFNLGYVEEWKDGEDRLTISKRYGAYVLLGFVKGVHISESYRTATLARKAKAKHIANRISFY